MSRACPDCAAPLESGERFCGECGGYAGWSGEEPETTTADGPTEAPNSTGPPPPPPAPPSEPPPAEPPPPPPPAGDGWQPPPAATRSMVVPVDRQAQGPGPQQPDAPAAPPRPGPPAPPDDMPIRHGDLVCGECGAGNKASRRFCRRCGTPLAEAETAKEPWWRRLFRRRPRRPRAGARPRVRPRVRVPARLFIVLSLLAALGVSGYVLRGYVVGGYDTVRDRISGVEKVNPSLSASSAQPGHAARRARDGNSASYWAPAGPGDGRGAALVATFEESVRLVYLLLIPGASGTKEDVFLAHGRPARLRAELRRVDGPTVVKHVDLEDKLGDVEIRLATSDVTEARLEIVDAHAGAAPDSHTAIAEVEFYIRR